MRFSSLVLVSSALMFAACSPKTTSDTADKAAKATEAAAKKKPAGHGDKGHGHKGHGDKAKGAHKKQATGPLCEGFGPQTPRDIRRIAGTNPVTFDKAPSAAELNLCNIHTHTNAEHRGPGFKTLVDRTDHGGYACNGTEELTAEELVDPAGGNGAYKGVKPGDTIEVHWVHSSCDITPGPGLGSCLSDTCENPLLRVEAQVFLVVNDPENALNFTDFDYGGISETGFHTAKAIPQTKGKPVEFLGSTTGPKYTQSVCSPVNVTWSVRPHCAKLDIGSLNRWAEQGNVFNEAKSHGVRQLVTAPELLSPIE